MPGEWQPREKSGIPSWDKTKLKEEENPPDWVEPPQPKVEISLIPYKETFDAETRDLPVTPIETKEELLSADHIPQQHMEQTGGEDAQNGCFEMDKILNVPEGTASVMDVHAALDPAVLADLATSCGDQDSRPVPKDVAMARASQALGTKCK